VSCDVDENGARLDCASCLEPGRDVVIPTPRFRGWIPHGRWLACRRITHSLPWPVFQEYTHSTPRRVQAAHHRAFHAAAVLDGVHALRFASTRPAAGPSGTDAISARRAEGNCAMVRRLMARRTRLTSSRRRHMVKSSRKCRGHFPPFAVTAYGSRIRSTPSGQPLNAPLLNIAAR
jgi:hypothetical protein